MPINYKHLCSDKSILLLLAIAFFAVCIIRHHKNPSTALQSDAHGYYMYLPAVFSYKNIHSIPDQLFQGQTKNDRGETYTKYPCGTALCFLPFFLVAHAYTHLFGLDTTGFSNPYYYAIMVCGVMWSFLGIFLLLTLLSKYFSRTVTWITILSILLGTNFFNYATYEIGMSHIYSFALFAGIILTADRYYAAPTKSLAALLGFLAGWILLTRNTNVFLLIFVLLFNIVTVSDLKLRMRFFRTHYRHIVLAVLCFIAILIPQLAYWKEMTGSWITYSYKGESFSYLAHPKIAEVLFDTQNGLFTYSPILLFFLWPVINKRKDPRTNFWGICIVFPVITYLFASWWAWWFGGAFGHRSYVEYYTILAFPMAVTYERIVAIKKRALTIPFFLLVTICCYYNLNLSRLYFHNGPFDGPEWQWNWDKWYNELIKKTF